MHPEPQDLAHVHLPGHIDIFWDTFKPSLAPFAAENPLHFAPQALFNWAYQFRDSLIILECSNVFVEITRPCGAATKCVHFRPSQAIEVVELHRGQWRAQLDQLGRRRIEFSTLVIRADNEHAHIALVCLQDCGPVQIIHKIPMHVYVIELIAPNSIKNDVGGGMSREAHESNPPLTLQIASSVGASVFAESPVQMLAMVDTMQRQQIHVIQF